MLCRDRPAKQLPQLPAKLNLYKAEYPLRGRSAKRLCASKRFHPHPTAPYSHPVSALLPLAVQAQTAELGGCDPEGHGTARPGRSRSHDPEDPVRDLSVRRTGRQGSQAQLSLIFQKRFCFQGFPRKMRKAFFCIKNSDFFSETICNHAIICVNYRIKDNFGCRAPHTGIRKDTE